MISALHNDTKEGLLLSLPTITTIPYSLFNTSPCATVCPPALISTFCAPTGKYALAAASQSASHTSGSGSGRSWDESWTAIFFTTFHFIHCIP